jgi:hypothetical protein
MARRQERYTALDTNFKDFAENRGARWCMQFNEVFKRNLQFLGRNKNAISAVFFNSTFISLLILSLYWKIGIWPE